MRKLSHLVLAGALAAGLLLCAVPAQATVLENVTVTNIQDLTSDGSGFTFAQIDGGGNPTVFLFSAAAVAGTQGGTPFGNLTYAVDWSGTNPTTLGGDTFVNGDSFPSGKFPGPVTFPVPDAGGALLVGIFDNATFTLQSFGSYPLAPAGGANAPLFGIAPGFGSFTLDIEPAAVSAPEVNAPAAAPCLALLAGALALVSDRRRQAPAGA